MKKTPKRVILMRKAWAAGDAKRDAGNLEPCNIECIKNIPYGEYGIETMLDVCRPANCRETLPVIIDIHGGGYFYGDKELYRFYCMRLAQDGFAVINFNYRLSPENKFPAPLEDTLNVVKWVKSHADEFGFDINNVFLTGDSAGAQLASQYAAIHTNPEYAGLFGFEIPTEVKLRAVSLACGMYDMKERAKKADTSKMVTDYLGLKPDYNDPRYDCLGHITKDYPATYVFSSHEDFLKEECKPMADFLASKGIEVDSHIYGEAGNTKIGHVFHVNMKLEEGERANRAQLSFFKKHIKK